MGAIAATHGGVTVRPSVKVPTPAIVGANGAGDAFAAGLLYAFHEGWSIPDALALAHATAAASLRQMLTIGAVESWSRCLELADQWGWRMSLADAGTLLQMPRTSGHVLDRRNAPGPGRCGRRGMALRIFIGWDSREAECADVLAWPSCAVGRPACRGGLQGGPRSGPPGGRQC